MMTDKKMVVGIVLLVAALLIPLVMALFPPVVSFVNITSSNGYNDTLANLTAYFTASDADGDNVYNTTWQNTSSKKIVDIFPFNTANVSGVLGSNGSFGGADYLPNGGYDGSGVFNFTFSSIDYVDLGNDSKWTPTTGATWMAWIKFHGDYTSGSHRIARVQLGNGGGFDWYISNLGRIVFDTNNGSSSIFKNCVSDRYWSRGEYYHVAVSYVPNQTNNVRCYINGTEFGSATTGSYIGFSTNPFTISASSVGWNGTIDDFRIYDYNLTPEQISAIYLSEKTTGNANILSSSETTVNEIWSLNWISDDGVISGNAASMDVTIQNDSCIDGQITPYDDIVISGSQMLCARTYDLVDTSNDGVIKMAADSMLDCNGATLIGNLSGYAIARQFSTSHRVNVTNCNVESYDRGIFLSAVDGWNVYGNNVSYSNVGIYFGSGADNNTAYNNTLQHNTDFSIELFNNGGSNVTTNIIQNGTVLLNTVVDAIAYGNNVSMLEVDTDYDFTSECIELKDSNFTTLEGNVCERSVIGFSFTGSLKDVTVKNNTAIRNDRGANLYGVYGKNVSIIGNSFINNTMDYDTYGLAVAVTSSQGIDFEMNELSYLTTAGFRIHNSTNITFNNTVFEFIPLANRSGYFNLDKDEVPSAFIFSELYKGWMPQFIGFPSNGIIISNSQYDLDDMVAFMTAEGDNQITDDFPSDYWYVSFDTNISVTGKDLGKYEYFLNGNFSSVNNWYNNSFDDDGNVGQFTGEINNKMFIVYQRDTPSNRFLNFTINKTGQTFKNVNGTQSYQLNLFNLSSPFDDVRLGGVVVAANVESFNLTLESGEMAEVGNYTFLNNVTNHSIGGQDATIEVWTSEETNFTVHYGTSTSVLDAERIGSSVRNSGWRGVQLSSLSFSSTYYYVVEFCNAFDACDNTSQFSFTTSVSAPAASLGGGSPPPPPAEVSPVTQSCAAGLVLVTDGVRSVCAEPCDGIVVINPDNTATCISCPEGKSFKGGLCVDDARAVRKVPDLISGLELLGGRVIPQSPWLGVAAIAGMATFIWFGVKEVNKVGRRKK